MFRNITPLLGLTFILSCAPEKENAVGFTEITKWHDDKQTAISITYDDGIINQFTVAKPIMDKYQMPGTFYILTGKVEGAQKGKFIGRPQEEIIAETENTKTNQDNFFERASLIAFTGTSEAADYHSRAGSLYEAGNVQEAYEVLDEGYEKIRNGTIKNTDDVVYHDNAEDTTTWEDFKQYVEQGHEIASHTVTHPRLCALDEANMLYELEQSKNDIEKYLGKASTFSAECPYGTENERVMEYAHKIYPSLRNRMPEPYLEELNRSSESDPRESNKEYVQWQRGPLSRHTVAEMKGWVETCMERDNIWLILVFHGVDQFGWEPKTGDELEEYFKFINDQRDNAWVATFADVTKYIRARKSASIMSSATEQDINVKMSSDLDPEVYNVPVTLKTYIPKDWKSVLINNEQIIDEIKSDERGNFVTYSASISQSSLILVEG